MGSVERPSRADSRSHRQGRAAHCMAEMGEPVNKLGGAAGQLGLCFGEQGLRSRHRKGTLEELVPKFDLEALARSRSLTGSTRASDCTLIRWKGESVSAGGGVACYIRAPERPRTHRRSRSGCSAEARSVCGNRQENHVDPIQRDGTVLRESCESSYAFQNER